jgi:hypothetical protein
MDLRSITLDAGYIGDFPQGECQAAGAGGNTAEGHRRSASASTAL